MKSKWDSRYRESNIGDSAPASVLQNNAHLLPENGLALDLACGLGANAIFLAQKGLMVSAWDISEVAIEKLKVFAGSSHLDITPEVYDVEALLPPMNSFDVIVVSYFLNRELAVPLMAALKTGGLLFYQTYTRTKITDSGPSNPDFLLAENELLTMFSSLRVIHYRDEARVGDLGSGFRNEAMLIAQKP